MKTIFIAGLHRSGTTILDMILGAHTDCIAVGEVDGVIRAERDRAWVESHYARCTCGQCEFWPAVMDAKVITIGHIIPLYAPMKDAPSTGKILYVGSANPINTQATNYFIKDILPRVRQASPNAQLLLAGKVCNTMEDSDNFTKLGELEDLKVAYDMADVVINPVPFGTEL